MEATHEKPVWELILSRMGDGNVMAREICKMLGGVHQKNLDDYLKAKKDQMTLEQANAKSLFNGLNGRLSAWNTKLRKLLPFGVNARLDWVPRSKAEGAKRQVKLYFSSTRKNDEWEDYNWKGPAGTKVRSLHASVPIQLRPVLAELKVRYSSHRDRWEALLKDEEVSKEQWEAHVERQWRSYCCKLMGKEASDSDFRILERLVEQPAICAVIGFRLLSKDTKRLLSKDTKLSPVDTERLQEDTIELYFARATFEEWIATTLSLDVIVADTKLRAQDVFQFPDLPWEGWHQFIPAVNALNVLVHVVSRDDYLISRKGTEPESKWQAAIQGFVDPILDTSRIDPDLPDHREAAFRLGRELLGQAISLTQIRWYGVCMAKINSGNVFILGSVTLDHTADEIMATAKQFNSSPQRAWKFGKIPFVREDFYKFVSKINEVSLAFEVGGSLALDRKDVAEDNVAPRRSSVRKSMKGC